MGEYVRLKIKRDSLEDHVKSICRSNLKKPAKICMKCPILGPVIEIMEDYGWKYNKEVMAEYIQDFYSNNKG